MLFLGIDLHLRQMTISLRNPGGDVLLRRQVSTRWPKLEEFRGQLRQVAAGDEKYVAILEVCGFHDWLVKWLQRDGRCQRVWWFSRWGEPCAEYVRAVSAVLSCDEAFIAIPLLGVLGGAIGYRRAAVFCSNYAQPATVWVGISVGKRRCL